MLKKSLVFAVILFIVACSSDRTNYKLWNQVPIDKKASLISENTISSFKIAVFRSRMPMQDLKTLYQQHQFSIISDQQTVLLSNKNVSIQLTPVSEKENNIVIRIMGDTD